MKKRERNKPTHATKGYNVKVGIQILLVDRKGATKGKESVGG